ncbi:Gfo/Idh/MocA family oxidoreductase [Aliiglaciecola sp.]|nr:Gfo/Idh/MocA family oxidoreductase [Aliiglaciecola sp.]
MSELRVLVCGAGSIGQRHISNLIKLDVSVIAWRERKDKIDELAAAFKISVFSDLDEAIELCDAVVVATETHKHIDIALRAARSKKHLFIEKPVSHTLDYLQKLNAIVEENRSIVEIGSMLRASETLQELKAITDNQIYGEVLTYRAVMGQRLDTWRPDSDYRDSYSADRDKGGGALMDLIHQIDLVQFLFGKIDVVYCFNQTVGALEIKAETLSSLTLEGERGLSGQVQVDMISPVYRGSIEVVTSDALLVWNIQTNVLQITEQNGQQKVISPSDSFERNNLFENHMAHFLSRVKNKNVLALSSLKDGVMALNTVLTAYKSSAYGRKLPVQSVHWLK